MPKLLVHYSQPSQPDQPLVAGVQKIVRQANGSIRLVEASQGSLLLAQLSLDQRGLWLQVAAGVRGVHVNGRPVKRMALLRAGDAVYVEGVELLIQGEVDTPMLPPSPQAAVQSDEPRLLRGVGGPHHGRGFPLDGPLLVGRSSEADIEIDEPAFAEQHARIESHGERILLRDLGTGEGSRVNGVAVRHCWLQGGDQVVFDGQHRFVLELPDDPRQRPLPTEEFVFNDIDDAAEPQAPRRVRRWPWLLVSALLLAGVLSLLLWFGAR